jgi:hypothetical protein
MAPSDLSGRGVIRSGGIRAACALALRELVEHYVDEFGEADADASGLLAILASGEV